MRTDRFDYALPAAAIAQEPVEPRDAARLLVDRGPSEPAEHRHVRDLPALLGPGDLVVLNSTRVLPARLRLHKPSGGAVEVLLLEPVVPGSSDWVALVRPSRRVPPGTRLVAGDDLSVEVGADLGEGRRRVHLATSADSASGDTSSGDTPGPVVAALARHGVLPLPPYITTDLADPERYQTVYANEPTSVAAPTAGLHLTSALLEKCRAAGATIATLELAVGLGTFRPIATEQVEQHQMHEERYAVPTATIEACERARRVVAVGTTTLRALETAAATGKLEGRTDLFIHGDHRFQVVDALLTNFHQPRSSLLVLIDAFLGGGPSGERWRALYNEALVTGYRFLSFGDAMFLQRREVAA